MHLCLDLQPVVIEYLRADLNGRPESVDVHGVLHALDLAGEILATYQDPGPAVTPLFPRVPADRSLYSTPHSIIHDLCHAVILSWRARQKPPCFTWATGA